VQHHYLPPQQLQQPTTERESAPSWCKVAINDTDGVHLTFDYTSYGYVKSMGKTLYVHEARDGLNRKVDGAGFIKIQDHKLTDLSGPKQYFVIVATNRAGDAISEKVYCGYLPTQEIENYLY